MGHFEIWVLILWLKHANYKMYELFYLMLNFELKNSRLAKNLNNKSLKLDRYIIVLNM